MKKIVLVFLVILISSTVSCGQLLDHKFTRKTLGKRKEEVKKLWNKNFPDAFVYSLGNSDADSLICSGPGYQYTYYFEKSLKRCFRITLSPFPAEARIYQASLKTFTIRQETALPNAELYYDLKNRVSYFVFQYDIYTDIIIEPFPDWLR